MLKKTITYTDYDGNSRTEDFWFNLSKAEIIRLEFSESGGMEKLLNKMIAEQDSKKLMNMFETLILTAYGEKSGDGKRFIKSEELSTAFKQTEAYSELIVELLSDEKAASEFVNKVMPQIPTENRAAFPAN
nr:MAG TPA: hypothetical protein [Caudoviricetes sp.]